MIQMKLDEIDQPLKMVGLRRRAYTSTTSFGCKVKNIDATVDFIFVTYCKGDELTMAELRVVKPSDKDTAKNNHPIDPTWLKNLLKDCFLPDIDIVDMEGRTFIKPLKSTQLKCYPPPVGERAIYHYLTSPLLLKHGDEIGVAWTFRDRIKTMDEAQEVLHGLQNVLEFFNEMEETHVLHERMEYQRKCISTCMENIAREEQALRLCHEKHNGALETLEKLGINYVK